MEYIEKSLGKIRDSEEAAKTVEAEDFGKRSLGEADGHSKCSAEEWAAWAREQDLSEADLPYIHGLLKISFADWLDEADGLPWLPEAKPFLVHPDGSTLCASDEADMEAALPRDWHAAAVGATAVGEALETRRPATVCAARQEWPPLRSRDSVAVPVLSRSGGIMLAVLGCLFPSGSVRESETKLLQAAALHFRTCFYRRFEHLLLNDDLLSRQATVREERRRDILFDVMNRLHDHIDVERILSEVLTCLENLYPACRADLFLSQDYSSSNDKVKPLAFHQTDMQLCRQAFLLGRMQEEKAGGYRRLAVPLAGKQGVYGVLRLDLPEGACDETDLRFVTMLTSGAGTAFEKAMLHEQANALVSELRLINELTQQLNRSLRLSDTMEFAKAELLGLFRAEFCCFLLKDANHERFVVVSSNVPELLNRTFAIGYGFIGVMWNTREPVILSDYNAATPVESALMEATGSRSLLASPLLLNGEMIGAVLVAHREPNHFSYDNYKLLKVLSTHLSLAVSNATLHAEMRRMAVTDHLTGLHARHYLNERIRKKQRKDDAGSLILVDIDHFKAINDTYGHQVGDAILTQVSGIIRSSIRETDIAARWGGEELAIYLPQIRFEHARKIAERIRSRVEAETNPPVTISCGVSEWTSADERISVETLFYRADMALYQAKNGGRNRVDAG